MNRNMFLFVFLLFSSVEAVKATNRILGQIVNNKNLEGISFASIKFEYSKKMSVSCDVNGRFCIRLSKNNIPKNDELVEISSIGFADIKLPFSKFREQVEIRGSIALHEIVYEEKVIEVEHKRLKTVVLGNDHTKNHLQFYHGSGCRFIWATKIPISNQLSYVEKVNIGVASLVGMDSLKIKISFRKVGKDGKPSLELLHPEVINSSLKEGYNTINLSKYFIEVKEDFFVVIYSEYVKERSVACLNRVFIGGGAFEKTPFSENWKKRVFNVIGVNVEVLQ